MLHGQERPDIAAGDANIEPQAEVMVYGAGEAYHKQ